MRAQHLISLLLGAGICVGAFFLQQAYIDRTIDQAGSHLAQEEAKAFAIMRDATADHLRAALAAQTIPDMARAIERAATTGGPQCGSCPICDVPYHLNPNPDQWRSTTPNEDLVVCPGPHTTDDTLTFHGSSGEPHWWPGITMD